MLIKQSSEPLHNLFFAFLDSFIKVIDDLMHFVVIPSDSLEHIC